MPKTVMYPYCEIAYKTEESIGWKLAMVNGDKRTVTKEIKKYNWFDYIVFGCGEGVSPIRNNFNYYPRPDDVNYRTYWIYWNDLNRWFVKEDEIIPYPQKKCEVTDKIQFSYIFETNDNWNDPDDFDNEDEIYVSAEVSFKTKKQKTRGIIEISALYDDFEKFINNLKTKNFGVCHIEEFTQYKLLAWKKDNKVRFLVQDYNGTSDKEYIPIVFDILTDENRFFKHFEAFYNSLKKDSQNLMREITEAVKQR